MNRTGHKTLNLETAAIYLAWISMITWLLMSGKYQIFIRQSFWALMIWAIAILGLFFFSIIRRVSMRNNPVPKAATFIRLGTVIIPIFYILMAQEKSLGSYAFQMRSTMQGLQKSQSIGEAQGTSAENSNGVTRSTAQDFQNLQSAVKGAAPLPSDGKVTILQIMENIDNWKGKKVIAEGMVYRDDKVPGRHIVVYRFLMTCCVADASPLSMLVETDNADQFKEDQWVRVEGVLSLKKAEGLDTPHIKAEQITPINTPEDTYLYPSFY